MWQKRTWTPLHYTWSGALCHGLDKGLLFSVQGNLNSALYNHISDRKTVQFNFVKVVYLRPLLVSKWQFPCAQNHIHKDVCEDWGPKCSHCGCTGQTKSVMSSWHCEPDLISQHQCWTSLTLLWLNGSKSLQADSTSAGKQNRACCYRSRLNPVVLERDD